MAKSSLHIDENTPIDSSPPQFGLIEIAIALSSERDYQRLVERILIEAQNITKADGGSFYGVNEADQSLVFEIVSNNSLNLKLGGSYGEPITIPPVPLYLANGQPNLNNVVSSVYHERAISVIDDAYKDPLHDFSGTRQFDLRFGYRSRSFLTIPLINSRQEIIAIIQLINARNPQDHIVPFDKSILPLVQSLANIAAVAMDNQSLMDDQKNLWDAMIKMIASSIDHKSPYTGGHCQRVPELALMMAKAACETTSGEFAKFTMNDEEMYELHVAAWLHDCGKITTPEYVMDKATKLETLYNRIHEIRTRFEVKWRDAEIECLQRQLAGEDKAKCEKDRHDRQQSLQDDFRFLASLNDGVNPLSEGDKQRLSQISEIGWLRHFPKNLGLSKPEQMLISSEQWEEALPAQDWLIMDLPEHVIGPYNRGEIYNLLIASGTLTPEERKTIQEHIVVTQSMLNSLPFPKIMRNVVEYAGGHHEKMDGTGYPNGLTKDELSIPARIMAIADIFEALTAPDRPYKPALKLSKALSIMKSMAMKQHIDIDLYHLFLDSQVWLTYANSFLHKSQLDVSDISAFYPD